MNSELGGYKGNSDIPHYRTIKISNLEGLRYYAGILHKTHIDFNVLPDKLKKDYIIILYAEGIDSIRLLN